MYDQNFHHGSLAVPPAVFLSVLLAHTPVHTLSVPLTTFAGGEKVKGKEGGERERKGGRRERKERREERDKGDVPQGTSYTTCTCTYLIALLESLFILLSHPFGLCKLCNGRGNTWSQFHLYSYPCMQTPSGWGCPRRQWVELPLEPVGGAPPGGSGWGSPGSLHGHLVADD